MACGTPKVGGSPSSSPPYTSRAASRHSPSPAPQPVLRHLPQSPGEVLRAEGQEGPLTASGGGHAGGVEGGATLPAARAVGGTLP